MFSIDVRETYPFELIRLLYAASMTYTLGSRSVDYTERHYVPVLDFLSRGQSMGSRISEFIPITLSDLEANIQKIVTERYPLLER
jgi:hypothetical protein